jgi:hypothetical protein
MNKDFVVTLIFKSVIDILTIASVLPYYKAELLFGWDDKGWR